MAEAGINAAIDTFLDSADNGGDAEQVKSHLLSAQADDEDIAVGEGGPDEGGLDYETGRKRPGGEGGGGFGGLMNILGQLTGGGGHGGGGGLASIFGTLLSAIGTQNSSRQDSILQNFAEKTMATNNSSVLNTIVNYFAGNQNNNVLVSFIQRLLNIKKESAPSGQSNFIESIINKLMSNPGSPDLPGLVKGALVGNGGRHHAADD